MKKKLIILVLMASTLLLVTGCGKTKETEKKEESNTQLIELTDTKLGFKTTFTVDKEAKYTDIEVDTESGASAELEFENVELDVEFQMYYNVMYEDSYNKMKESRMSQKYYKEYQFGEYEAYAYGDYADGLYLNIILDDDENEQLDILFVSVDRMDNSEKIVADIVNGEEVQNLFNSLKFEKIN